MEQITIFSLPLAQVTQVAPVLDAQFFTQIIEQAPTIGKETDRYYLLNNNLTLQNPNSEFRVNIFNNFVMHSQRKGHMLQLVKHNENEQRQDEQESQTESK